MNLMNTSKSLDLHKILSETIQVYKLQAGESREGKVWFNVMNEPFALSFDYTAAAIVEAVEGLIMPYESVSKTMTLTEIHDIATRNSFRDDFLQAIKEWQ